MAMRNAPKADTRYNNGNRPGGALLDEHDHRQELQRNVNRASVGDIVIVVLVIVGLMLALLWALG